MNDEAAPPKIPNHPFDDHFAAELRGFGPAGIISILVILLSSVFLGNVPVPVTVMLVLGGWPGCNFFENIGVPYTPVLRVGFLVY